MFLIGIKQNGFNREFLLSENSAHWLTYFNPDSKLKFQTANHYNSAGVECFDNIDKACDVMEGLKAFGIKNCFIARVEKHDIYVVYE